MLNFKILDRYLFREAGLAWLAVTGVLLAIMLSTRFAKFLTEAARGTLPADFLLKIVALNSLQYLVLLIPVSLLLAVMLSLGRLYKDQEIAAMAGCGLGLRRFYKPFLWLALAIASLTALLAFGLGPWAGREVDRSLRDARTSVQYSPFEPGRFKTVASGRATFYGATADAEGRVQTVFAQIEEDGGASIVTAQTGVQALDEATGERILTLNQGQRYYGEPGRADYDIIAFDSLTTRVAPPPTLALSGKRKTRETQSLIGSEDLADQAELQWRIAAPVSVFLLALLAVPLSHLAPRAGRYSKLIWGILAYLIYSNLLGLGQTWIAKGVMPAAIGLWWVHALMGMLLLWILQQRMGGFTGRSSIRKAAA
mgnify:CR=1 FL=1